MRIGIFGGSFNPPHKMHMKMIQTLIDENYVDKVIFVPAGHKYEYKHNLIADEHRLNMLNLLTKDNDNLETSNYELKDYVVYTCDTLAHFKEKYPNDQICFICGADNLSYIDKWKNGLSLLANYKIIVVKRKGQDINELLDKFKEYKDNIIVSNVPSVDISSTMIREKINNNEDVSQYLDNRIIDYIKRNNLYKNNQ